MHNQQEAKNIEIIMYNIDAVDMTQVSVEAEIELALAMNKAAQLDLTCLDLGNPKIKQRVDELKTHYQTAMNLIQQ